MGSIAQKLGKFALYFYALGLQSALIYMLRRIQNKLSKKSKLVSLSTPLAEFQLNARLGSSDFDVFYQIFIQREYREMTAVESEIKWIIDCGANVGYSAAYFASRFKNATVIALEPDPENFAILVKNIEPYQGRLIAVQAGIWHSDGELVLVKGEFGDGREWASQTRMVSKGEKADVIVYGIKTIMSQFNINVIDILKIDIEGAELDLFSMQVSEWLPYVNQLVIELHGSECVHSFYSALKETDFLYQFRTTGEITIATKIKAL